MKRKCNDENTKIVKRIYDWDGKHVEIDLCEIHLSDPDFEYFVTEYSLQEVVSN
ncbi:MAG: hypothetical protein HQ505_06595 [Nitrosopumilus sp.]|nr:hypothetical protein [Nitrosopumilus sp.]